MYSRGAAGGCMVSCVRGRSDDCLTAGRSAYVGGGGGGGGGGVLRLRADRPWACAPGCGGCQRASVGRGCESGRFPSGGPARGGTRDCTCSRIFRTTIGSVTSEGGPRLPTAIGHRNRPPQSGQEVMSIWKTRRTWPSHGSAQVMGASGSASLAPVATRPLAPCPGGAWVRQRLGVTGPQGGAVDSWARTPPMPARGIG